MSVVPYPAAVEGHGLVLRLWDADLVRQMARWGEHGFPFAAFDLGYLRQPARASATLNRMRERGQHRHFVACEAGRAVGRVSVNLDDPAGLYLWSVHVPPEHEGRGVCRRMLATLMTWLEETAPGRDFVLSSNAFAAHAHRAYQALGFEVSETRWHFDREIASQLWRVEASRRELIARHTRFMNGRWEVRAYIFRRPRGAPMELATPALAATR